MEHGLTRAKLARRIGKSPEIITRLLGAPSNLDDRHHKRPFTWHLRRGMDSFFLIGSPPATSERAAARPSSSNEPVSDASTRAVEHSAAAGRMRRCCKGRGFRLRDCSERHRRAWRETCSSSPIRPRGRTSSVPTSRRPIRITCKRTALRLVDRRHHLRDGIAAGRPDAPDDDRAEQGAPVVGAAAEDQHGPDLEGQDRLEVERADIADEADIEPAGQPHDHAAEHEGLQADADRVLAERGGRRLVLADRFQRATPGRADDALERQVGEAHDQRRPGRDRTGCR